jgi:hypothetical protein
MTEPQQIQVLDLVTELGTLMRDEKMEIAGIRSDQQRNDASVEAKLADYGRRLSLAEAKGAITAAMDAASESLAAAASPSAPSGLPLPLTQASNTAGSTATVAADSPRRYRVQAASPNLAMLSEIDLNGDDGGELEIALGDAVPGYGRVTGIVQRGTIWVVETDRGTIE